MINEDLKQKISSWWNGRVYGTQPGEDAPYIGFVYSKSSIQARKVVDYMKREHKFLIGTLLTIVSLMVVIFTL